MTDRLAVVTRLALLALAQFYAAGKVTIIDFFAEHMGPGAERSDHLSQVVNVDVTGRDELRDQLADAIIECDVYHVHEPACYPWEFWTTDGGTNYRGLVGQLLTMWVRIEEITGYTPQPAASDPAAVPGVPIPPPAGWVDSGSGPGYPVASADFPSFADWKRAGRPWTLADVVPTVGIAPVKPTLTPEPVKAALTEPHPLAVLLDDADTAALLTEGSAMEWPTVDEAPATHPAWRKWAMHSIEQDARTSGPYADYAAALAAVRAHPAVRSLEPDDVISLAYGLVAPPARPRRSWWSLRTMLTAESAE
jgi:hypothetical protein